jgi:hypothetical protein
MSIEDRGKDTVAVPRISVPHVIGNHPEHQNSIRRISEVQL